MKALKRTTSLKGTACQVEAERKERKKEGEVKESESAGR